MDEKGFMIGKLQKTKRIFNLQHYASGKLLGSGEDGNREWITLIACICADGESLPPAIIYSATTGNLQTSWLEDFDSDEHAVHFASSEKGWTNDQLGFKWLELFDRYTRTKARQGRDWRVLWADGHGSHLSMEFLSWSIEHRIHIAVYPSHSTHRLQPLDVGLFSPLASYYSTNLSNFIASTRGYIPVGKREFFTLFWPAFQKAFSKKNIDSAWKKAGIWPWNPESVLDIIKPDNLNIEQDKPSTPPGPSSINIPLDLRWREMRKAVDTADKQATYDLIERLQAENQILKHQVAGYEEVLKYKQRRKKKGKPLFELQEGETAGWYSPQKVKAAQDRLKQLEEEEKQQQQLKEQERLQRQQRKEEKQQQVAARKLERKKIQAEKAAQEAIRKAQREEEAIQKQAAKQLQDRVKSTNQKQLGKNKKKVQFDIAEGSDSNAVCTQEEVPSVSRSGRVRRQPKHLQGYKL